MEGMWLMLQKDRPDDYVLASGTATSVRSFCELAAEALAFDLVWEGEGSDTIGIDRRSRNTIIRINPKNYRPAEVDLLVGDASRAQERLGWSSKTTLARLIEMMVEADLRRARDGQRFF